MKRSMLHKRRTLFGVLISSLLFFSSSFTQSVSPAGKKEVLDIIHKREGKILLLNIWATWCLPCKEEFPDLINIYHEYKTNDVDVIAISVDFPDEIDSKILPFLRKSKADMPVYVADFPTQDDFFALFDKRWTGGIPMTFVYDANGKLRKSLLGKRSLKDFRNAIEEVTKNR